MERWGSGALNGRRSVRAGPLTVSCLDVNVGEPFMVVLDGEASARFYSGYDVEGMEPWREFKYGVSVWTYLTAGHYTPKVVYTDGQERILPTIVVREVVERKSA